MSAPLSNQRWSTPNEIFARSLTLGDADLPRGWTKNSVVIEPGTRACAVVDGHFIGDIPAGEFTFHDFRDKLQFWRKGDATLLLTRTDVVRLPVDCNGIVSYDEVPMDIRVDVGVQIDNPVAFVKNMMGPRKEYSVKELAERLTPSVRQEAWAATARLRVDDLRGPAMVTRVAQQIGSAISDTFKRYGLKVFSIEGVLMQPTGMERHWEKVKENNIEVAGERLTNKRLGQDIGVQEERVPLEGKLRDIQQAGERAAMESETTHQTAKLAHEVSTLSDRIPLFEKLRDAAIANEFDKAKSAEELKQLMAAVDKQRLLRKEEMDQLAEGFEERRDNRQSLREHIVRVLDINREQEVDALRLAVEHSLALAAKKNELELAEATSSVENLEWRNEVAREIELAEKRRDERKKDLAAKWDRIREAQRQKNDASWERLLHDQREETIRTELAYKEAERKRRLQLLEAENIAAVERQKIVGERLRREFDLEMGGRESDAQFDRLKRVQDMNFEGHARQAQLDAELKGQVELRANTHELERLKTMGSLSAEALIATSGTDNAKALADLKIQEAKTQAEIQAASRGDQQALNDERLRLYEKLNEAERGKADAIASVFNQALKGQQDAVAQMIGGLATAHTPPRPTSPAVALPAVAAAVAEWHVASGGGQSGPHSVRQVQVMVQQGQIGTDALVWKAGMEGWIAIVDCGEFAGVFATVPPVPPPPPPRA